MEHAFGVSSRLRTLRVAEEAGKEGRIHTRNKKKKLAVTEAGRHQAVRSGAEQMLPCRRTVRSTLFYDMYSQHYNNLRHTPRVGKTCRYTTPTGGRPHVSLDAAALPRPGGTATALRSPQTGPGPSPRQVSLPRCRTASRCIGCPCPGAPTGKHQSAGTEGYPRQEHGARCVVKSMAETRNPTTLDLVQTPRPQLAARTTNTN